METLTNNTPKLAYFNWIETGRANTLSFSISAAKVMAAGSVMKEPSNGTTESTKKYNTMPW